jgi:NTE family protein
MSPTEATTWPVERIADDQLGADPGDGVGLCLSGGGTRAMLFHAGALWRLNELGLLPRLDRVSSVSGGSITAGVLGMRWRDLAFDATTGVSPAFESVVVAPLRRLAGRNLDIRLGIEGALLPGVNAADRYRDALGTHLYGDATLADLPAEGEGPRFIFNATNLASGVLWRFSRPYARDWRVGSIPEPRFPIAAAVAASGAFPPFFAPLELDVSPEDFDPGSGADLQLPGYTDRIRLGDGGIYDNLGLETVFKRCRTVLVSDGGGRLADDPAPPTDWARMTLRVMKIIDSQVRSLRKRLLIAAYQRGDREGAYWGIRSSIEEHRVPGTLPCPPEATMVLAELPTRLARVPAARQRGLINWGYAIADAAIRSSYPDRYEAPVRFPYDGGVG